MSGPALVAHSGLADFNFILGFAYEQRCNIPAELRDTTLSLNTAHFNISPYCTLAVVAFQTSWVFVL